MGLLGVNCPEDYGGLGADILFAAVSWEEQCYAKGSPTGPGFALHSVLIVRGRADEEHRLFILSAVRTLGTQWPKIASQLHNRTPDAVRNRWHRLQKAHAFDAPDSCQQRTDAADALLCAAGAPAPGGKIKGALSLQGWFELLPERML